MATGKRLITLYIGMTEGGGAYDSYTDADFEHFSEEASGFVIIPGTYKKYLVENHEGELNTMLNQMATLVTRIHKQRSDCEIWIGTPHLPDRNDTSLSELPFAQYATQLKNCISSMKQKINGWIGEPNAFDQYITGIYMNDEHIIGENHKGGMALNHTSLSTMLKHPQVNMYNTVSSYVHGLGKQMLWIPYYGFYADDLLETIVDLGYIANRTNIFDYVLIQPHYYFNKSNNNKANLAAIRASMLQNRVTYRAESNGTFTPVCSKTSNTIIGCQMEVDNSIINGRTKIPGQDDATSSELITRFGDCIRIFTDKSNGFNPSNEHFSFYCGSKTPTLSKIQDKIAEFYKSVM